MISRSPRFISTLWKFQDFSISQILREIKCEDSGSAKSAILTRLGALNCDFYEFLHFLKADIYQLSKIVAFTTFLSKMREREFP